METGPWFKVSSERPEKRGIDLATPGLVVWSVIHYATAAPLCNEEAEKNTCNIILVSISCQLFIIVLCIESRYELSCIPLFLFVHSDTT